MGTPPGERLKDFAETTNKRKSMQSANGTLQSITPGRKSFSEFMGRTPKVKSAPIPEPTNVNSPKSTLKVSNLDDNQEEELTVHDHGIMLLLGNGRRTKARSKHKSVIMAPEKETVHLITPMVGGKTQAMPRTPSPEATRSGPPVVLRSPPVPISHIPSKHDKVHGGDRDPIVTIPESPVIESQPTTSNTQPEVDKQKSKSKDSSCPNVKSRTKTPTNDMYFGFDISMDDSVFQTCTPVVPEPPNDSSRKSLVTQTSNKSDTATKENTGVKRKKSGMHPRKAAMEGKPPEPSHSNVEKLVDSVNKEDKSPERTRSVDKSKQAKSIKKSKGDPETGVDSRAEEIPSTSSGYNTDVTQIDKTVLENDTSPKSTKPPKSSRRDKSRSRVKTLEKCELEKDSTEIESSPPVSKQKVSKTPAAKATKTPAAKKTKTPAPPKSAKSAKTASKSTKKSAKTPGTTKKVTDCIS